jgi:hypothetical protein
MKKIIGFAAATILSSATLYSPAYSCGRWIYICLSFNENGQCTSWQATCADEGGATPGVDFAPLPSVLDQIPAGVSEFELYLKDGKNNVNVLKKIEE